jgi:hypothetical protein
MENAAGMRIIPEQFRRPEIRTEPMCCQGNNFSEREFIIPRAIKNKLSHYKLLEGKTKTL